MNATEERLRDALKTVGETVGPEGVPEPGFAVRRRRLPRHVLMASAVAASAAVVVGGAMAGGAFSSGDTAHPLSPPSAAPAQKVAVFLCSRTSSNPSCNGQEATKWQKQEVKRRLDACPQVRGVEFESSPEAVERFKERFEKYEVVLRMLEKGDIPEAFRVTLAPGAEADSVVKAVLGRPGVDTVLVEGR